MLVDGAGRLWDVDAEGHEQVEEMEGRPADHVHHYQSHDQNHQLIKGFNYRAICGPTLSETSSGLGRADSA